VARWNVSIGLPLTFTSTFQVACTAAAARASTTATRIRAAFALHDVRHALRTPCRRNVAVGRNENGLAARANPCENPSLRVI
jgi:hypothetical protein